MVLQYGIRLSYFGGSPRSGGWGRMVVARERVVLMVGNNYEFILCSCYGCPLGLLDVSGSSNVARVIIRHSHYWGDDGASFVR